MRGSDIVDLLFAWLPRHWVQAGIVVLFAVMYLTHRYEPSLWYVADKADGITELWMEFWRSYLAALPTPSLTPNR